MKLASSTIAEVEAIPCQLLEFEEDEHRCIDCSWSFFPNDSQCSNLFRLTVGMLDTSIGVCLFCTSVPADECFITSDDTDKTMNCHTFLGGK